MKSEAKVFISYAKEDYETAKRLYDDLKEAGAEPWLDDEDLLSGSIADFWMQTRVGRSQNTGRTDKKQTRAAGGGC